jgi:YHS domain-containing protein
MTRQQMWLAVVFSTAFVPGTAAAQHDAHEAGIAPASAEMAQCARVQPSIDKIIAAAMSRAESARLSNVPAELRAATDHLESALRDIRTQLAPCSAAAGAVDPHAGHQMPGPQKPPSSPEATQKPARTAKPAPAAADPHAGHTMPAKPAGGEKPAIKPIAETPKPDKGDPHAGHAMTEKTADPAGKQMDPVNGLMVDPATAPRSTYQGQTYYFSSEESRKEFLANPAKFAKKP